MTLVTSSLLSCLRTDENWMFLMCPIYLWCGDIFECLRANWLYSMSTGMCRATQQIAAKMWLMGCQQIPICIRWLWKLITERGGAMKRREKKIARNLLWFHVNWCMSTSCVAPRIISCVTLLTSIPYWRSAVKACSFYEKMRGTWCVFFPSSGLVMLGTHTLQSHCL